MNSSNVAQVLIKKKPEARLSDFLVQKHSSGIEHVSESSTSNRQKKARELRSGFLDIQHLRSEYMQANLTQQLSKKNPSTGARDKKLLQTEGSARILQNLK